MSVRLLSFYLGGQQTFFRIKYNMVQGNNSGLTKIGHYLEKNVFKIEVIKYINNNQSMYS